MRSRGAEVPQWPRREAARLTTQPLASHTKQGGPLVPVNALPSESDHMVHFVNTLSSLSLPAPISAAQVLVAFLSLPTRSNPHSSTSRHTQPVQGVWDLLHPPLRYKSPVNNPLGRPPQTDFWKNSGPGWEIMKVSFLCTQGRKWHRQVRTRLHAPCPSGMEA